MSVEPRLCMRRNEMGSPVVRVPRPECRYYYKSVFSCTKHASRSGGGIDNVPAIHAHDWPRQTRARNPSAVRVPVLRRRRASHSGLSSCSALNGVLGLIGLGRVEARAQPHDPHARASAPPALRGRDCRGGLVEDGVGIKIRHWGGY